MEWEWEMEEESVIPGFVNTWREFVSRAYLTSNLVSEKRSSPESELQEEYSFQSQLLFPDECSYFRSFFIADHWVEFVSKGGGERERVVIEACDLLSHPFVFQPLRVWIYTFRLHSHEKKRKWTRVGDTDTHPITTVISFTWWTASHSFLFPDHPSLPA